MSHLSLSTVIRCPLHPIPGNAKVQNQTCNDLVNSECTFLCNNGFRLVGSQTRTCQWDGSSEQGSWSGVEPVCEGKKNKNPTPHPTPQQSHVHHER